MKTIFIKLKKAQCSACRGAVKQADGKLLYSILPEWKKSDAQGRRNASDVYAATLQLLSIDVIYKQAKKKGSPK